MPTRNAKIVCTLGPATADAETVRSLADAGMSVARINTSHGTVESRAALVETTQEVGHTHDDPLAVMLDLQGPDVRTADVDDPVTLEQGSTVRLEPGDTVSPERVGISTSIAAVSPGDRVLVDDGRIETVVEGVEGESVVVRVESGGEVGGHKGINVPGVDLDLDVVTEKDQADLDLAVEYDVDYVAASFVSSADDVLAVGSELEARDAAIPLVAKIERASAVDDLDAIVDAADGVMVARGDLGVECPFEDVPLIQKRIIRAGQEAGTPVITATEMLDSMVHSSRPTRAEASDVANAVLDGTDAVMLSAETAVGDHPVRVVETMDRIVRQVERSEEYAELRDQRVPGVSAGRTDALARSARYLARDLDASAVVVATESGYTARALSKFRPAVPIVAATPDEAVRRRLSLSWGVQAERATYAGGGADAVIEEAVQTSLDAGIVESGDTVVVLSGMMTELEGADTTNLLKVHVAAETLAVGRAVVDGRVTGPVEFVEGGTVTDVPEDAILVLPEGYEGTLAVEDARVGGIVSADPGLTSYPAMVARELGVPMVSAASLPASVEAGDVVTLDGERGTVYAGRIRPAGVSDVPRDVGVR
ncbi:MAG: pyruvate kinase [Haloarculaceae archaeon]